ncbi:centrosomal protein of 85 kDa-like [Spea bombifrons]|uniref:centrosomal protein of 85 kDa-like n=1 Tax=Spea bombifrons TaxID=233779 RepID=UPI00234A8F30|nr:centrosomal protein of 85 kDa-like [Spea bombifrons]
MVRIWTSDLPPACQLPRPAPALGSVRSSHCFAPGCPACLFTNTGVTPAGMWGRMISNYGPGFNSYPSGSDFPPSGWLPGSDTLWHTAAGTSTGRSSHVRRLSITSDSGDTGIGTSCSDSLEDHSTSSATSTFKPVNSMVCLPSTARSSLSRHTEEMLDTSQWDSNYSLPGGNRCYGLSDAPLDMKDSRPMKKPRWPN